MVSAILMETVNKEKAMDRTIREMVEGKPMVWVKASASVREAARVMYERDVGAVVVMEDAKLAGIFTERDALRFFTATRRNPDTIDVGVVMTRDPVTIGGGRPVRQARDIMLAAGFRHLPVVDGETVLGVVSLRGIDLDDSLVRS